MKKALLLGLFISLSAHAGEHTGIGLGTETTPLAGQSSIIVGDALVAAGNSSVVIDLGTPALNGGVVSSPSIAGQGSAVVTKTSKAVIANGQTGVGSPVRKIAGEGSVIGCGAV